MEKIRRISLAGIIVFVLATFILFVGLKDYQQQGININAKYDIQQNLANLSLSLEMTSISIKKVQFKLENEPTKKEIIQREIDSKLREMQIEKLSIIDKITKQRKEELDSRIFNLLSYVSLAITIFIFGVSLFWRKKDVIHMGKQQEAILTKLNKQNQIIEEVKESLHFHHKTLDKENHLLKEAFNKQIEYSEILTGKIDIFLKLNEETNKQVAVVKEDDNCSS
ncbi:hypothetical protein ACK1LH_03270 [Metabacillus indicus]|uniref:hypothetical protein n=1 Tax=Metabacillus indicus TaxID=246786 RepID=UPI0039845544